MAESEMVDLIGRIGRRAKDAAAGLALAPCAAKDQALLDAAAGLRAGQAALLEANAKDMEAGRTAGLSRALLDRLLLTPERIEGMAVGLEVVAALEDPVGRELARWRRPNGLDIARVAVPLGVVGVIYESRPNVTADAAGLCLKAGNAVILRGGSDSFHSSRAIHAIIADAVAKAGLPADAAQMIPTTDRAAVGALLAASQHVDVIVPRGGKSLVARVQAESRVPVFAHLDGNNHTYLHASAGPNMALDLVLNAKLRRTGVCGATETLLVDRAAAARLLPPILDALAAKGCEIHGCAETLAIWPNGQPADEADWSTEFLDAVLAVKVVAGLDEAIGHVNGFGSHHTDCIVARDADAAERFLAEVDSAIVTHNASTQYADGGEFGFGAEIGIATGRLHARGPVGLEQLVTYKYQVRGSGQCRPG
ncbi:glutamate-5-semialdehyde dehydrogenase [Geminicoccus harenae]|uniref:glutamate-5-semialdehyde dehydrogenase n=2 Tax=Geminicoccus harenae TaxID=2498453 RepID=UPI001C961720|nr:glutamate-5-semialdehyde dehydrogenase [Geminicoccus harenae]